MHITNTSCKTKESNATSTQLDKAPKTFAYFCKNNYSPKNILRLHWAGKRNVLETSASSKEGSKECNFKQKNLKRA